MYLDLQCNVMKSCDQSCDGSNRIETISDHYWSHIPRGWFSHQSPDLPNQPSDFQINFSNQLFKSTFRINFLNQPMQSTFSLNRRRHWLVVCRFLRRMNIGRCTSTYWGTYNSSSWFSCRSPTRRGVKHITLEHPLVSVWMKALLDIARTSPLCGCQLCL